MQDLEKYNDNLEEWFLERQASDFPNSESLVSKYNEIVKALKSIQKQVTIGADVTDGTSLTWHDESHIKKVIKQVSKLLFYKEANISPFEAFVLLVAIQIHDIKNIEGREEHENRAISIFNDLHIVGLVDSILLKNIGFVASCHAGNISLNGRMEKDKISLLATSVFNAEKKIRLRLLAALLRLADEYADDSERAMSYLLKIGKIKKGSIIHHKHAESLVDVNIEAGSGKVDFDYHLAAEDALKKFPKYIKETDTYKDVYLLDEIFERTVKSHYETIYCMRYLRPDISVTKIHVSIEIEHLTITRQLNIKYELEEIGYPNSELTILQLCGERYLRQNGKYWSGENLKTYLENTKSLI